MPKNINKYYYKTFGLIVESEILLPELFDFDYNREPIDVKVWIGKVPDKTGIAGLQKPISAYNKDEYWQEIPNMAKYYAKNGSEIIIEPLCENWGEIRLFLQTNIWYAVLFQRNTLPVFASGVVDKNGNAVVFAGKKLTGKSTILFQLINRGYTPFSDMAIVFSIQNGQTWVLPTFNTIYLWKSTFEKLIENEKNYTFSKLRPQINKISIGNLSNGFSGKALKLAKIIVLDEAKSASTINIKELLPKEAFDLLHEIHARPQWIEDMGLHIENFKLLSQISKNITVFKAERPSQKDCIEDFGSMIESLILKK